ncbi:hypothetical protein SAMN05444398_10817 [Roseovarius pacificus]|uniref:Uncharacterized protein n=1 Tax=Roseovarius pacificus TaxID=337701 RepID=A0A1M7EZH7_9RHOB|nr:hypothetical protein [Roseovarius pacificus]GGO58662.1 hypothetical protein GCM10011315_28760 [Roseovarius pacificus]SHL97131.1 hypothetical protein SAMN05444398_10817 [Roseovarius pacificus]
MTYKSPPAPHPTGMRREDFEELREQQGMTPAGFREDSSDPLRGDKEAMERELLMWADDHLTRRTRRDR